MVLVMVMRPAGQRRTLSANPHRTQSKTGPRGETHTAGGKDAVVPVPGLQAAGAAVADELLGAGVVLRGGAPPVPGVSSGGGGLGVRGAPGVLHRPALPGAHPSGAPAACSAGARLGWVGLSASTQSSVIPVIPRDGAPAVCPRRRKVVGVVVSRRWLRVSAQAWVPVLTSTAHSMLIPLGGSHLDRAFRSADACGRGRR